MNHPKNIYDKLFGDKPLDEVLRQSGQQMELLKNQKPSKFMTVTKHGVSETVLYPKKLKP